MTRRVVAAVCLAAVMLAVLVCQSSAAATTKPPITTAATKAPSPKGTVECYECGYPEPCTKNMTLWDTCPGKVCLKLEVKTAGKKHVIRGCLSERKCPEFPGNATVSYDRCYYCDSKLCNSVPSAMQLGSVQLLAATAAGVVLLLQIVGRLY